MDLMNKAYNHTFIDAHSLEYYKSLLENTVECVWVYDLKSQCFKYISPSIFNLRGLTVEEAMKEHLEDCLTFESLQKIEKESFKKFPSFLSGDRSDKILCEVSEYQQFCKDGSIKIVEIATRLVFNADCSSIDIIGVSRDITERKHYENELMNVLREKMELLQKLNHCIMENVTSPRIYCWGKFKVYGSNCSDPIKWHNVKAEELFAFLLHKRCEFISKDEICEALWPNIDIEKSTTYLHTTLYHLEKDLSSIDFSFHISFDNNNYFYQLPEFYSDIEEFRNLLDNAILPFDSVDDQSVGDYERAISIYTGNYLNENGYIWSLSENMLSRKQFEAAALSLSRYYFLQHNYEATKRVLKRLIDNDNLNESVHELLLKVYLQENDYSSFITHYANLEKLLQSELGAAPKKSLQNLFNNFYKIRQNNTTTQTY